MTPEIFRQALTSTARVACAAALVGCGPKEAPPESAATAPLPTDPETDRGEVVEQPAQGEVSETCEAHVNEVFSADDPKPTMQTRACCEAMAAHFSKEEHAASFGADWEQRMECCTLLEWQGSVACTPWGPPTPPRMTRA